MYKKIIEENKELINMNDRYYTAHGKHNWDMNTYLVDMEERVQYLIDNGDIIDEDSLEDGCDEDEYYGLVSWDDVVNLTNIEELKMYSWMTKELEYNPYIISFMRNS